MKEEIGSIGKTLDGAMNTYINSLMQEIERIDNQHAFIYRVDTTRVNESLEQEQNKVLVMINTVLSDEAIIELKSEMLTFRKIVMKYLEYDIKQRNELTRLKNCIKNTERDIRVLTARHAIENKVESKLQAISGEDIKIIPCNRKKSIKRIRTEKLINNKICYVIKERMNKSERILILSAVINYFEELKNRKQVIINKLQEELHTLRNKFQLKVRVEQQCDMLKLFINSVNKIKDRVYNRALSLKQLPRNNTDSTNNLYTLNPFIRFTAADKRAVIYDFIGQPQVTFFILTNASIRNITPLKKVNRRICVNNHVKSLAKLPHIKPYASRKQSPVRIRLRFERSKDTLESSTSYKYRYVNYSKLTTLDKH